MPDGEIILTEIQETQWDEQAVIDSPFEAKDFIKVLPWQEYSSELDEYDSLRSKMRQRNKGWTDSMEAACDAWEAYEDSHDVADDFATHVSWDRQINKWTIDADAFEEARKFWEYAGFKVSVDPSVNLDALKA